MRAIVFMLFAAVGFLQGCSAPMRSGELDAGGFQKITWTKGHEGEAFRDQHGVCQLFTRDTQAALTGLGEQVKACFDGSLPRMLVKTTDAKTIKVAWNKVPRERLNGLYADTMSQHAILLMNTSARRKSHAPLMSVRGFYTYIADTCHIVVPDQAEYAGTLGHEFKHCVDGLFHNEHGEWLQGEPA